MSYGQQGWQPQDAVPQQPMTYTNQYGQYVPQPGAQAYYPPQPPVVVNVTQNAGAGSFTVRQPVRHGLHAVLTLLTGGLWLFVWIPAALRGGKKVRVYR
jgi:hypothetical protein